MNLAEEKTKCIRCNKKVRDEKGWLPKTWGIWFRLEEGGDIVLACKKCWQQWALVEEEAKSNFFVGK